MTNFVKGALGGLACVGAFVAVIFHAPDDAVGWIVPAMLGLLVIVSFFYLVPVKDRSLKKLLMGLGIGLGIVGVFWLAVVLAPDGATVWIMSLGPVALVGFHFGYRLPDDNLKRWSTSHGVPITDENRDVVVRHLTRGRRIRTAGAVIGYYGYLVFTVEFGRDEVSWGWWRSVFFGYLIAAGIAEVWALRLRPQGSRTASLTLREVRTYLPRAAMFLLRLGAISTVALAIAWEWIPHAAGPPNIVLPQEIRPGVAGMIVWAALSVAVLVFAEVVIRKIVRRPQPAVGDELLRVDDAIRSGSIHQVAGAALALVLGIYAARALVMAPTSSHVFNPVFGVTGVFAGIGSIFAWLRLGIDQPWVVRRPQPQQQVAA